MCVIETSIPSVFLGIMLTLHAEFEGYAPAKYSESVYWQMCLCVWYKFLFSPFSGTPLPPPPPSVTETNSTQISAVFDAGLPVSTLKPAGIGDPS